MKNITHKLFFVALLLMGTTIYAQESSEESWEDLEELEEIVLVGGGVIDLAEDRKTPVAVSTITGEEIQKKIGTQDITMTLANTPSILSVGLKIYSYQLLVLLHPYQLHQKYQNFPYLLQVYIDQ